MTLDSYMNALQQFFDGLVEHATDDELFAGGYLRGHVDLAIGRMQVAQLSLSIAELNQTVSDSLQQAIAQGELSTQDQTLVNALWGKAQAAQ